MMLAGHRGLRLSFAAFAEYRRLQNVTRTTACGSAAATAQIRPRIAALAHFWKIPAIQVPTPLLPLKALAAAVVLPAKEAADRPRELR